LINGSDEPRFYSEGERHEEVCKVVGLDLDRDGVAHSGDGRG
jgi:hypothetical protein